jgi:pyrroloquinoline quinone biosynthesis protein D
MIALDGASRPHLARKVRLRWDAREQTVILLGPDRGLVLNATAAAIAERCDGAYSIDGIVDALAERHPDQDRETIERAVYEFLRRLDERGWLTCAP